MILKIYTDGGAKGNPGPASIGIVGYIDNKETFRYREDIGVATNNVAEYSAVVKALHIVKEKVSNSTLHVSSIEFYSDSSLLVNQVNGLFKVNNGAIREFIVQIRMLEQEIGLPVRYQHIPREKNTVADNLVNNK